MPPFDTWQFLDFGSTDTLLSVLNVFKVDTQLYSVDQNAVQQRDISSSESNRGWTCCVELRL